MQVAWPDDLHGLVNDHLLIFAAEWHWTPEQVWALELWQLVDFSRALDRLVEQRKRAAKERGRRA